MVLRGEQVDLSAGSDKSNCCREGFRDLVTVAGPARSVGLCCADVNEALGEDAAAETVFIDVIRNS
jgi:hypothetical protein